MLVPVVCFTCGSPVGQVEDLFLAMRGRLVEAALGARQVSPTQAAVAAGLRVDCTPIFEALRVDNDCCRTRLATAMEFQSYYSC
jgi:DNA-directed RNA polymerase subunit N (RpoN/RPB10)